MSEFECVGMFVSLSVSVCICVCLCICGSVYILYAVHSKFT